MVVLGLGLLAAGCGRAGPGPQPGLFSQPAPSSGGLSAILPSSDIAVGQDQRFLIVLLGPDNQIVSDASLDLQFFKVTGPQQAQARAHASTQYRESPGAGGRGAYVARTNFDEPGQWGVAAHVQRPGQPPSELQLSFEVKDRSSTPARGQPVPASATLTGSTAAEIERFSSARPVNPRLYRLSIADALREQKPLVVVFATPGFCTSRLCGPSLEVLETLEAEYRDRANFIHVEIYKDGRPNDRLEVVPAVREWGLTSEPWLFVVGPDGRLVDKFEGVFSVEEVRPVVSALVRSG